MRSRTAPVHIVVALVVVGFAAIAPLYADDDFVVWHAYNVKFDRGARQPSFLASIYVLNLTGSDFRELTFTARAPEGFTISLPPPEIQQAFRRPQGFAEEMAGANYVMQQPFLGAGQATTIFYQLHFEGRLDEVVFPGIQIQYTQGEAAKTFQALDETYVMGRYTRFSGDINNFIRKYTGMTLKLGLGKDAPEWSFSAPDYRAFGTNPIGMVDVAGSPEGSGYFRVQGGFPGDLREVLLRWEAKKRSRKDPLDQEFLRQELDTMIRWVGDYSVDPETLEVSDVEVSRLPAVLAKGRWNDNKKLRLGSGLFRLYMLHYHDRDIYLFLLVQGRGVGPDHADQPAPEKEEALMKELVGYVDTFRP